MVEPDLAFTMESIITDYRQLRGIMGPSVERRPGPLCVSDSLGLGCRYGAGVNHGPISPIIKRRGGEDRAGHAMLAFSNR